MVMIYDYFLYAVRLEISHFLIFNLNEQRTENNSNHDDLIPFGVIHKVPLILLCRIILSRMPNKFEFGATFSIVFISQIGSGLYLI